VRDDFRDLDDEHWRGNQRATRSRDGSVTTTFHPVAAQDIS
jgi:hypothetical protein